MSNRSIFASKYLFDTSSNSIYLKCPLMVIIKLHNNYPNTDPQLNIFDSRCISISLKSMQTNSCFIIFHTKCFLQPKLSRYTVTISLENDFFDRTPSKKKNHECNHSNYCEKTSREGIN